MLVNKSGRRLVIGRINVKSGEILPGIPFTAGERKGVEKFLAKGYIAEVEAEKPAEAAVEAHNADEPKAANQAEAPKAEASKAEEPKAEEPAEAPKAEPAYTKYSRRRKKVAEAEAEAAVTEDGVGSNN